MPLSPWGTDPSRGKIGGLWTTPRVAILSADNQARTPPVLVLELWNLLPSPSTWLARTNSVATAGCRACIIGRQSEQLTQLDYGFGNPVQFFFTRVSFNWPSFLHNDKNYWYLKDWWIRVITHRKKNGSMSLQVAVNTKTTKVKVNTANVARTSLNLSKLTPTNVLIRAAAAMRLLLSSTHYRLCSHVCNCFRTSNLMNNLMRSFFSSEIRLLPLLGFHVWHASPIFLCDLALCRPCSAEDFPVPVPPIPTVDLFLSHCCHSTTSIQPLSILFLVVDSSALLFVPSLLLSRDPRLRHDILVHSLFSYPIEIQQVSDSPLSNRKRGEERGGFEGG